ncbi:MAG: chorismate mutase [Candidatus Ozemobacteraceae bacterium]
MTDSLEDKRREIDELDSSLVKLLHKRAELAKTIGRAKQEDGRPVWAPVREAEVLAAVSLGAAGLFPKEALNAVFREIISACRRMETDEKVGILGEKYGWIHDAARRRFGISAELAPMTHAEEILHSLGRRDIGYGFFALNAGHPDLPMILENFLGRHLFITSETRYRRGFSLVSRGSGDLSGLEEVFITAEVLGWLRRWAVSLSYPVKISICRSMEEVVENLVEGRQVAGVVPQNLAKHMDMHILQTGLIPVEELPVRCFTISTKPFEGTLEKGMRGTLLLSVPDLPGALLAALAPIRDAHLDVASIETFKFHGKAWDVLFWVDFSIPTDAAVLEHLLKAVETKCRIFAFLGAYPVLE